jgi:hypothetical protein
MYYVVRKDTADGGWCACLCFLKGEEQYRSAAGLYWISDGGVKNKTECKRMYPDLDIVKLINLKKYFFNEEAKANGTKKIQKLHRLCAVNKSR